MNVNILYYFLISPDSLFFQVSKLYFIELENDKFVKIICARLFLKKEKKNRSNKFAIETSCRHHAANQSSRISMRNNEKKKS